MKVIIVGWFGEKNIGDELILDSAHEVVLDNLKPTEIYVASNQKVASKYKWIYDHDFTFKSWLKLFLRGNISKNIKAWLSSDIIIFCIGGGLSDWNKIVAKRVLNRIKFFRFLNKKIYFLGVGAGPFVGNYHPDYLNKKFSEVNNFLVRDETSFNNLKSIGLNNVTLTNDIVFENKQLITHFNNRKNQKEDVVIIPAPLFYNDLWKNNRENFKKYVESLNKTIDFLSEKHNVVVLPFQPEFDYEYLLKHLNTTSNFELFEYSNFEQAYEKMISAKLVIPMRFHGLVLATLFEKPSIPMIYDHKLYDLSKNLGIEHIGLDVGDGVNWKEKIFTIEDFQDSYTKVIKEYDQIVENCKKYKNKANKNGSELRRIL